MKVNEMKLNEHIQQLRETRGFSAAELSTKSHILENHIRSIEKGKSQPTVYVLLQILEALNIKPVEFFREDDQAVYPSDYEKELLEVTRRLSGEGAEVILLLAKMLAEGKQ